MDSEQSNSDLLLHGEFISCDLTPMGSNYTFLASLKLGEQDGQAIYKPRDGEVSLVGFPQRDVV